MKIYIYKCVYDCPYILVITVQNRTGDRGGDSGAHTRSFLHSQIIAGGQYKS